MAGTAAAGTVTEKITTNTGSPTTKSISVSDRNNNKQLDQEHEKNNNKLATVSITATNKNTDKDNFSKQNGVSNYQDPNSDFSRRNNESIYSSNLDSNLSKGASIVSDNKSDQPLSTQKMTSTSTNSTQTSSASTNGSNHDIENREKPDNDNDIAGIQQDLSIADPQYHMLQTSWSLWLYTNNKARSWDENLQHVISFQTVEEFWAVYNHIQMASRLAAGHDYALFRSGMRPAWEDEANKSGGRWMLSLNSKQYRKSDLDRLWLEVMLLIIGEDFDTLDQSQLINGAVVSIRFKDDRIALWTGRADCVADQKAIGVQLKQRLGLPQDISISFEVHADQSGPKSKRGPRYQL